jgi:hypothetical protein
MATTNDITGDALISRKLTKEGEDNWDKIFGVKKKEKYIPPPLPDDMYELEQKLDDIQKTNGS